MHVQMTTRTTISATAGFHSACPAATTPSSASSASSPCIVADLTLTSSRLFHGNVVLDSAVPTKLLNLCAYKDDREFTHIRYSAATRDSNDFKDNGFTLRTVHYDPPRRTELFIIVEMYNEDDALFALTMHGVMKDIAYICKRDRSKTSGKEGCEKVVVCIVSDGGGNHN